MQIATLFLTNLRITFPLLNVSLFIRRQMNCTVCPVTGDRGLNLVKKSDIPLPEYVAEALPDLIKSVPSRHGDSTEIKVFQLSL